MPTYSLDPTGAALQNAVIGESKTLNLPIGRNYLFVVPTYGPFFEESLIIRHTSLAGVSRILEPSVDYYAGFKFQDATRKSNRPIYGAIAFVDNTLTGNITYSYQALGGQFILSSGNITSIQANEVRDPKFTTWEQVATPATFPVVDFPYSVVNIPDITKAVSELSKAGLVVHLRPKFLPAPGQTVFIPNKSEIGLSNVENYGPATNLEAIRGLSTTTLMTPANTAAVIGPAVSLALTTIGYKIPVVYKAGLELDSINKTVIFNNQIYSPKASVIPFTTSGTFESSNFVIVSTNSKDVWDKTTLTVIGSETISNEYIEFPITVEHNSRVVPQLFLNDILFLVFGVDYLLTTQKLLVKYPLAVTDRLVLFTKKPVSSQASDNTIYQKITVTSGANTFALNDNTINPLNLRVTLNDVIVLDDTLDYSVSNGYMLTVTYPLEIGDVLEIENIDSMPIYGKAKVRELII